MRLDFDRRLKLDLDGSNVTSDARLLPNPERGACAPAMCTAPMTGADDWEAALKPVVVRDEGRKIRLYFRSDAAFASPEIYEHL